MQPRFVEVGTGDRFHPRGIEHRVGLPQPVQPFGKRLKRGDALWIDGAMQLALLAPITLDAFALDDLAHEIDAATAQPNDSLVGGSSEEHTSELQSLMRTSSAVFCLKKKKQQ